MCTSILQIAKNGVHVLSRTMDWPTLENSPLFVPRNFEWQTVFDHRTHHNKYALIGGGSMKNGRIDVSDGVNEFGLCAQKLTFANGAQLVDERDTTKTQLAPFEFVFWVLGNFKSVLDIEHHLPEVELMSEKFSDWKYGKPELHFSLVDPTGRIVVIEPTQNPMRIIENPLGVVTNSPHFERQLARLEKYVNFTAEFEAGKVALNTPKVTTGNLSGKAIPPGSYSPGARFIRAAYFKERADQPEDEQSAIISSWHLLESVSVPRNSAHQQTFSVYRAATVAESRSYYFQSYNRGEITKLQLTPAMLDWTKPKIYSVKDELTVNSLN
ncbi:choloylglycine hydrolase family protein [Paucilactobacillus wasatchensis]|uniref:Penicillin V acylase related amidase n=1 Tax=Paucilactobacillus wasatchensis TaxID=1335616 RepID=A0A0D1A7E7_9LACO|nr:choloylglycine hydrolase family protein [Paucilactobacillus wasatchensis]KIS02631.1 Penicillin V acylase related amidase [Paucilactobacillus wasatchensis]